MAWGSPEKKLGTGEVGVGSRGMAGAAADRRWGVFSGRAWRRTAGHGRRGGGCLAGDGWRLRGVEFDDKLEALDFVSNGWKI